MATVEQQVHPQRQQRALAQTVAVTVAQVAQLQHPARQVAQEPRFILVVAGVVQAMALAQPLVVQVALMGLVAVVELLQ